MIFSLKISEDLGCPFGVVGKISRSKISWIMF
jgi:hypothetical protein